MSQRLNNLNDIIAVLRSGAQFYRKGARQTDWEELEAICLEHADLRESVARELAQIVDEAGHEPANPSPTEKAHEALTRLGSLFGDKNSNLIAGLEEHEDRTLEAFRKAIHHRDNDRDEQMLRSYMTQFEQSHERMRTLKRDGRQTAAAQPAPPAAEEVTSEESDPRHVG